MNGTSIEPHEILEDLPSSADEKPSPPHHDDPNTNGSIRLSEGPPPKKRKLTDTASPRPTSPPWKKVGVEGPTSFVEDGRRKSSRTNTVPLELQPQRRQTRAAFHKTYQSKAKSSRSSLNGFSSATPTHHAESVVRRHDPSSKITPQHHGKQFTRNLDSKSSTGSTASQNHHYRIHSQDQISHPTTSHTVSTRTAKSTRLPSSPPQADPSETMRNGFDIDTPPNDGHSPRETRRKLKLNVKKPTVSIQHPMHVVAPRLYNSLREWMENEWTEEKDHGKFLMTREEATEKGHNRYDVLEARKPGGLLSDERCSVFKPDPQDEPPQQYGHYDHLVAHALNFRSLMWREQKTHARLRGSVNQMAMAAWKARQPKTSEDTLAEEKESNQKKYTEVVKDIRHLWEAVVKEIERRRLVRWQQEQEVLRREKLDQMIETSRKLVQHHRPSMASDADTVEEDTASENVAETSDEDESNMSSDDESSSDPDPEEDVDAGLTREELMKKYGDIEISREDAVDVIPEDGSSSVAPAISASQSNIADMDLPDTPMMDVDESALPSAADQSVAGIEVEEVEDALLDDSDESTDMEDDMGDSDGEGPDKEGKSEDDGPGLLGFLSEDDFTETPSESAEDSPSRIAQDELVGSDPAENHITPATEQDVPVIRPSADEKKAAEMQDPIVRHEQTLPSLATGKETRQASAGAPEPRSDLDNVKEDGKNASGRDQSDVEEVVKSQASRKTPVPSLLRGTLREYQHDGLDWLAEQYVKETNSILADEMGLGKTIQSIALLAHLAVEHGVWGPHLIVVPTSVVLNWEMEFKKWCPGFKILTYYGTQEERKRKRQGWLDDNAWHVCITSYQLVTQDVQAFRRRNWHYLILDEAHNIKNFKSQRWITLLKFKTKARLLLTGTPLQNNLAELWSLLTFLHWKDDQEDGFTDMSTFKAWFGKPENEILEHGRDIMDNDSKGTVAKLHEILRPYILRRMKADVEQQMPAKFEHVVACRLSKRQRLLYDGFMGLSETKQKLATGSYVSIMNTLMQLRKVCNHPDLFETRAITTSFAMPRSAVADFEIKELLVRRRLFQEQSDHVDLDLLNLAPISRENMSALDAIQGSMIHAYRPLQSLRERQYKRTNWGMGFDGSSMNAALMSLDNLGRKARFRELERTLYLESLRHRREPIYGASLLQRLTIVPPTQPKPRPSKRSQLLEWFTTQSAVMPGLLQTVEQRSSWLEPIIQKFMCLTPAVVTSDVTPAALTERGTRTIRKALAAMPADPYHEARMRSSIAFPDKRLLQYDCGKLQRLDQLLRELQSGGHRALIFTQMTRVLDILEQFLNIHGHRYLRLDGTTKVEQRQALTDRFNNDTRILAFILSSRSGGLGINLTGADTVIFYDLDWNPAMDKQCQDRCHRIGQTRDVHIYRFISEYTIESNILRKANQKRMLDDVVIQEGDFTTDYLHKLSVRDIVGEDLLQGEGDANADMDLALGQISKDSGQYEEKEDADAARLAEKEMQHVDEADFDERPVSQSGAGTPKPSNPQTPRDGLGASTPDVRSDAVEESTTLDAYQSGLVDPEHRPGVSREGGVDMVPHVDEYMLRIVEEELKDVPIAPPVDKSKKSKKGRDHRPKRTR